MTRTLWAFTWIRWRMLINSLRSAQRRDAVERVSRAASLIIPGLFLASACSSVLAALGFGAFAGWYSVVHPMQAVSVLTAIRVFLLLIGIFAVLVPLFVGAHGGAGRVTRFLLLPVSRRTLHAIEVCSSLTDPWMVFVTPGLIAYALGMFAGVLVTPEVWLHRFYFASVVAFAGAVGIAVVFASLSSTIAFLVSWLVRDRRRGEIFVLVFIVMLSGASLAPAFLSRTFDGSAAAASGRAQTSWVMAELPWWTRPLPSELYGAAVGAASSASSPWLPLAGLFAEGAVLYALSSAVHRRVIESVESGRTRRHQTRSTGRAFRIPGMWPGSSAVATAQVRTAMRSVRGRLVVLLPGPVVAMLAMTFSHVHADGTWVSVLGSHGYAAFGAGIVIALYAAQAFTLNQFGSDRSGLTREFIAPIRDVDLVRGKAAGCAAIIGAGAALSLLCALAVAPEGSPLLWIATFLGGAAAFLILTPAAALLSIVLPVASDLSKTGSAGNPHGLAMAAGMFLVGLAVLPAGAIIAMLSPSAALVAMAIWLAIAASIAMPLLSLVSRLLKLRRENLALVAQGR